MNTYIVTYNSHVHHIVASSYEECLEKIISIEGYSECIKEAVFNSQVIKR
jgi:hypothetical protein